ncbi:hypothetical protein GCM10022408_03490 [Hymenobacter fastidiosus]|uniref:SWIM-type domain-containing protein n=1 Tax=Hymenobacter fastidiosus TaxID=486264 RepID=A0ABP7RE76_9BACT
MFTLADLRAEATAASFSRGQAYFEVGAVGRVRHRVEDDYFSAFVRGSIDYSVALTLTGEGPDFWCDCPYDHEGICKHCVALGLAVLNKFGPEAATFKSGARSPKNPETPPQIAGATNPAAPVDAVVSASELEAALRKVGKPEKLKFLELQLRQSPALARAFITHFYGPALLPDPLDADPTLPQLEALRDEMRHALGSLRFGYGELADDDGKKPVIMFGIGAGASRFVLPLAQRIAQVLEPALLPAAHAIEAALAAGRLAEGLRRWHGAWLGISAATRPATDEYYLFSDRYYAPQVAEVWMQLMAETGVERWLRQQNFAPAEAARCLPLLIRPVVEALWPSRPGQPQWAPTLPQGGQALLLAAAANPSLAPALREVLRPHAGQLSVLLKMGLAAGCHDWAAWEPLAVQQALLSPTVALSLLQFYLDHDRRPDLLRAAELYLPRYAQLVGPFVLAQVRPAEHRALYVKALAQRLNAGQDFADFETLAGLWTDKERTAFVLRVLVQMPNQFSPLFRARVLLAENRAAELLPLVLGFNWHPRPRSSGWSMYAPPDLTDLPEILVLAARHDPEATLDAVMERTEDYLDDKTRRSPELYQRIGSWLKMLYELPALTDQVLLFAEGLYTKHNKLSCLREALREAQVLPEPEALPRPPVRAGAARRAPKPRNPFGK